MRQFCDQLRARLCVARSFAVALSFVLLPASLVSTSAMAASRPRRVFAGLLLSAKPVATATLRQCLAAEAQEERSATFAGEMTATPGTAKMEMRIDVLERVPGELTYHLVSAPGLGGWSASDPGVKTYRHLDKVTNLAAPAFYRAIVRFRWLNAKGRIIAANELRTRRCEQPMPAVSETPTPSGSGAPSAPSSTG